jgi:predicted nucleic acid-binding protein
MKGFLLDTNAWIALLKNHGTVVERVRRADLGPLYLCAPVWSEL